MNRKNYSEVRAHYQERANRTKQLFRLSRDFFGDWNAVMVPHIRNQYGRDLEGELIEPENANDRLVARGEA